MTGIYNEIWKEKFTNRSLPLQLSAREKKNKINTLFNEGSTKQPTDWLICGSRFQMESNFECPLKNSKAWRTKFTKIGDIIRLLDGVGFTLHKLTTKYINQTVTKWVYINLLSSFTFSLPKPYIKLPRV